MPFGLDTQGGGAPWSGLPSAQQPWNAQQNAPWRLSPWQTQGMPSGAPAVGPGAPAASPPSGLLTPESYLPEGTSAQLPNFNPKVPGGGFYPETQQPAPAAPTPAPAGPIFTQPGAAGQQYAGWGLLPGGVAGYETGSPGTPGGQSQVVNQHGAPVNNAQHARIQAQQQQAPWQQQGSVNPMQHLLGRQQSGLFGGW